LDSEKTQHNKWLENLLREECATDKTQRAGIFLITLATPPEKTDRNIGNPHSSYPYSSWWPEEEEVSVTVDMAASMVDVVVEEDRTTLALGRQLRVVSVLHWVTMCLTVDTERLQIRWELVGKACTVRRYKLWTGHQQWAIEQDPCDTYQTSPYSRSLDKAFPFENRWFEPEKRTYNGHAYQSKSS
jgi:hypothetical protein